MSNYGCRRRRPRGMSLEKFSSAARRSTMDGLLSTTARQQTVSHTAGVEAGLVLPSHLVSLVLPLAQVCFDLCAAPKIIAYHGIEVRQMEGRVLLYDLLRCRTFIEGGHDGIKGHPSSGNPHDAVSVHLQWHWVGFEQETHPPCLLAPYYNIFWRKIQCPAWPSARAWKSPCCTLLRPEYCSCSETRAGRWPSRIAPTSSRPDRSAREGTGRELLEDPAVRRMYLGG